MLTCEDIKSPDRAIQFKSHCHAISGGEWYIMNIGMRVSCWEPTTIIAFPYMLHFITSILKSQVISAIFIHKLHHFFPLIASLFKSSSFSKTWLPEVDK